MNDFELITFYIINVQGLTKEKFHSILQEIQPVQYDFICFTETWLKKTEVYDYEIPEYLTINKPRS